jgi:hypothetical protein
VKAEHAIWFSYVAADDINTKNAFHPRRELYKFLDTQSRRKVSTCLQTLESWTPSDMLQVTADLYDWQILSFSWTDQQQWHVTSVRGCLNSRQVFIGFMSLGSDPTSGQPNHWQPIFPLQKFYDVELRESEYRAQPVGYTLKDFEDYKSLLDSENIKSSLHIPDKIGQPLGKELTLVSASKNSLYQSSIFASSLGLLESFPRSDPLLRADGQHSVVPERLVPPAMCFVFPRRTMAGVKVHIPHGEKHVASKTAIQTLLQVPSSPLALQPKSLVAQPKSLVAQSKSLVPQPKPFNTSTPVKPDLGLQILDPVLLQRLQQEGYAPPFPLDLFKSSVLLNDMKGKGRLLQYVQMMQLYSRSSALPR